MINRKNMSFNKKVNFSGDEKHDVCKKKLLAFFFDFEKIHFNIKYSSTEKKINQSLSHKKISTLLFHSS